MKAILTFLLSITIHAVVRNACACDTIVINNAATLIQEKFGSSQVTFLMINMNQLSASLSKAVNFYKVQSQKSRQSFVGMAYQLSLNKSSNALLSTGILTCVSTQTELNDLVSAVDKMNLGSKKPMVALIQNISSIANLDDIARNISINQEIYYLDLSSGDIKEAYAINKIASVRSIGRVTSMNVKGKSYSFLPNPNVTSSFVLRRSNFMGQHIKVSSVHLQPSQFFIPISMPMLR